jgi:hypothetical protein
LTNFDSPHVRYRIKIARPAVKRNSQIARASDSCSDITSCAQAVKATEPNDGHAQRRKKENRIEQKRPKIEAEEKFEQKEPKIAKDLEICWRRWRVFKFRWLKFYETIQNFLRTN